MTIALWLSRAGLKVALAEAETLGYGSSGKCAGILTACRELIYSHLDEKYGASYTYAYAQTHISAIRAIHELVNRHEEQLAWQETSAIIIAVGRKKPHLMKETEGFRRAGLDSNVVNLDPELFGEGKGIQIQPAYLMDVLSYLDFLTEFAGKLGTQIFEHSRVNAVEAEVVYTEEGSIQAPYIVIATGYPIINTPGFFFLRMEQRRIQKRYIEERVLPDRIVFASDGRYSYRPCKNGGIIQQDNGLVGVLKKEFPQIVMRLGNQPVPYRIDEGIETYTADGFPYIGMYSARSPNLFVATGYGGNGIVGSMIAAQALTAQILGLPSQGYEIYSPQRSHAELMFPIRAGGRYMKGLFGGSEAPRCSHMGCKLAFNSLTRLWECPCHGSRFDDIGRVINAPAVKHAQLRGRK